MQGSEKRRILEPSYFITIHPALLSVILGYGPAYGEPRNCYDEYYLSKFTILFEHEAISK